MTPRSERGEGSIDERSDWSLQALLSHRWWAHYRHLQAQQVAKAKRQTCNGRQRVAAKKLTYSLVRDPAFDSVPIPCLLLCTEDWSLLDAFLLPSLPSDSAYLAVIANIHEELGQIGKPLPDHSSSEEIMITKRPEQ